MKSKVDFLDQNVYFPEQKVDFTLRLGKWTFEIFFQGQKHDSVKQKVDFLDQES